MSIKKFGFPLLVFLSASPLLNAATLTCSGSITAVTSHADGSVWIKPSWHNNGLQICNATTVQRNSARELQALARASAAGAQHT